MSRTKLSMKPEVDHLFCNILDLSAYNSYMIHSAINPSWNAHKSHRRRLYLLALGNELVEKYCFERNAPMLLQQPPSSSSSAKRGVCMI